MFHALTKVNQVCIVLDLIRQNANHSHNVANPEQQIANAKLMQMKTVYSIIAPSLAHIYCFFIIY